MLPSLRGSIFALGALGFAMTLSGQSAFAQANCAMYGKLALQQQKENATKKCGFTGSRWSDDLKAHIAWCGTVGPQQWKAELQLRKKMLEEQCGK